MSFALQAEYCSEDCRKRAFEEYHKILCFNGEEPPEPVKILDEYWRYECLNCDVKTTKNNMCN